MHLPKHKGVDHESPASTNSGRSEGRHTAFNMLREMAGRPAMGIRIIQGSEKKIATESEKRTGSATTNDNSITSFRKASRKRSNKSSLPKIVPFAPERLSIVNNTHVDKSMRSMASVANSPTMTGVVVASTKLHNNLLRLRDQQAERNVRTNSSVQDQQRIALQHQKVLEQYKIRAHDLQKTEEIELKKIPKNCSRFLIRPTSKWFKIWQMIVLLITLYQMYAVPFSLAFLHEETVNDIYRIYPNLIFTIDIFFHFNTIVRDHDIPDQFLTKRLHIAKQYISGWFLIDIVSAFPFDILFEFFYSKDLNFHVLELIRGVRIPRLLRLLQLTNLLRILRIGPSWSQWLLYSRYSHLIRLVSLIATFLTLTHFVACLWGGVISKKDWIMEIVPESDATTPYDMYTLCVYISLMTMLGQSLRMNSTRYFVFFSIATILGSLVMAILFGNVADLLANFYENNNNYKRKIESLFTSMDLMKLPEKLQQRINEYYQTMWKRYGTLNGTTNQFMNELSKNLAKEVELFLRMEMINRAPFFHDSSKKFIEEIVMKLELQVFLVGDYIIVRGEVGHDMYFVQSGICQVTKGNNIERIKSKELLLKEEEIIIKTLIQGDYFGEISLLMNVKRTAHVRAQTFTELCVLSRSTFDAISSRYLEDRTSIEKFITDKYDSSLIQELLQQQEINLSGGIAKEQQDLMTSNFQRVFDQLNIMEARLEVIQNAQQQAVYFEELRGCTQPRSRLGDDVGRKAGFFDDEQLVLTSVQE